MVVGSWAPFVSGMPMKTSIPRNADVPKIMDGNGAHKSVWNNKRKHIIAVEVERINVRNAEKFRMISPDILHDTIVLFYQRKHFSK